MTESADNSRLGCMCPSEQGPSSQTRRSGPELDCVDCLRGGKSAMRQSLFAVQAKLQAARTLMLEGVWPPRRDPHQWVSDRGDVLAPKIAPSPPGPRARRHSSTCLSASSLSPARSDHTRHGRLCRAPGPQPDPFASAFGAPAQLTPGRPARLRCPKDFASATASRGRWGGGGWSAGKSCIADVLGLGRWAGGTGRSAHGDCCQPMQGPHRNHHRRTIEHLCVGGRCPAGKRTTVKRRRAAVNAGIPRLCILATLEFNTTYC